MPNQMLTAAQINKLAHGKTLDSRITVKWDWTFGNLVLVDGIPLTACGQGWSQWCTLQNGCFMMRTTNDSGSHALACDVNITPARRLMAHWMGFVKNQTNPDLRGAVFS